MAVITEGTAFGISVPLAASNAYCVIVSEPLFGTNANLFPGSVRIMCEFMPGDLSSLGAPKLPSAPIGKMRVVPPL